MNQDGEKREQRLGKRYGKENKRERREMY